MAIVIVLRAQSSSVSSTVLSVLYCILCTVLYCTVLCTVMYCTVFYSVLPSALCTASFNIRICELERETDNIDNNMKDYNFGGLWPPCSSSFLCVFFCVFLFVVLFVFLSPLS